MTHTDKPHILPFSMKMRFRFKIFWFRLGIKNQTCSFPGNDRHRRRTARPAVRRHQGQARQRQSSRRRALACCQKVRHPSSLCSANDNRLIHTLVLSFSLFNWSRSVLLPARRRKIKKIKKVGFSKFDTPAWPIGRFTTKVIFLIWSINSFHSAVLRCSFTGNRTLLTRTSHDLSFMFVVYGRLDSPSGVCVHSVCLGSS